MLIVLAVRVFDVNDNGRHVRATNTRGLRYYAKIGDRVIVSRSHQPLLDARWRCAHQVIDGWCVKADLGSQGAGKSQKQTPRRR